MAGEGERIVFVTGKLAADPLREELARLSAEVGFTADVHVARISVAALITPDWLVGKLSIPEGTSRVILPGLCRGQTDRLCESLGGVPIERGPADLRDLDEYFSRRRQPDADFGSSDIQILAEINHANTIPLPALVEKSRLLVADGANVVDLGCTPGARWESIADAVRSLVAERIVVSVDTFDPWEAAAAGDAGASILLSANATNREAIAPVARANGMEVVAIPDQPADADWLGSLTETAQFLLDRSVRVRLDPVLEPIGFGFARSLGRYLATRDRFPELPMLMGIGNLTELTEVDSAGVNAMLVGFCQEVGIQSVLTTQVIPWARTSVRETAIAAGLMKYAVDRKALPKHVDSRLVLLRDPKVHAVRDEDLDRLQQRLRDENFRIFPVGDAIAVVNARGIERSRDPFELFDRLKVTDPSHAFYLGWEMMKAATAIQLGKEYRQDQALSWGFLTREETSHRDRRAGAVDPADANDDR